MREIYPQALDAGVPAWLFWDISLGDILAAINVAGRREQRKAEEIKAELRGQAAMVYKLATLVSIGFNDPKKFPSRERAFPGLFEDEESGEAAAPQWQRQQAAMTAWVAAYNDKVKARKE